MGRGVRFFNLPKIHWGKYVRLGDHVLISALGTRGVLLGDAVGIGAFSRLVVSTSMTNPGSFICIGNNVGIGEYAYLGGAGGLIIGQYFSCHPENHLFDDRGVPIRKQAVRREGITIGRDCWIGSKVTILDGVSIGEGCVIAAGAVVTRSVPSFSVIGGIPAKLLRARGEGRPS
jgi:acetyltransferase-like isoleucine patch superfamily enzyme